MGKKNGYGQYEVEHGVLRKELGNDIGNFSATLLAAKRLQIVTYKGEWILQGVHDAVKICLLQQPNNE